MKLKKSWGMVAALVLTGTLEVLVVRAQLRSPMEADPSKEKASLALLTAFRDATSQANKSTVKITGQDRGIIRPAVWGTVISEDGFILTKASEVAGLSRVWVALPMALEPGGGGGSVSQTRNYEAKLVGVSGAQDLAMLKVEARGLTPVSFASTFAPATRSATVSVPEGKVGVEVGEWVATARPWTDGQDIPEAVGVISVARRTIELKSGFFGISFSDAPPGGTGGVQIQQVVSDSAAEKAGILVGDVITAVNSVTTKARLEFQAVLKTVQPGVPVVFSVTREGRSITISAALASVDPQTETVTGGGVSRRSTDFSAVYQHDTVLDPTECGGPIVDLEGRVIGINIARAGRTETYALPADVIVPLLETLKSGKLAPK